MKKTGFTVRKRSAPKPQQEKLCYYLIYKPYGMLSQFSKDGDKPTLADLEYPFGKDVYPVGRLDHDSEGLLLLTNDKSLNSLLLNPKSHYSKSYWVQVDREITPDAIAALASGVTINVNGDYRTRPCHVNTIFAPVLPERVPPIRFRINVPTSWIEITLTEGKNRQIRKMTAAVGFPTLRLVRCAIGSLTIGNMQPGEVRALAPLEVSLLQQKK